MYLVYSQNVYNMIESVTLGAGCFWCVEAAFKELKGVLEVTPGYCGGNVVNPTYEQVYTGNTGHAEVCRIQFDTAEVSFHEILEVFWKIHDPTSLNRQGDEDIGTQYRSAIFYHSAAQKKIAEQYIEKLTDEQVWDSPIVTEINAMDIFYEAEDYHRNYLAKNPQNQYCQRVVIPKIEKFREIFKEKLRSI